MFVLMEGKKSSIGTVASIFIIILFGFYFVMYFHFNYIRKYNTLLSFISFYCIASAIYSIRILRTECRSIDIRNNHTNVILALPVPKPIINLTYSFGRTYHHNGIAYDYYSKDDVGKLNAGHQWKIWPLPNEINQTFIETSPFVISKLPFVDAIYVTSDPRLSDRQANIKIALLQQGIPIKSLKWKMKWNHMTCNSKSSRSYVYQRLNLKDEPLSHL
jgi:hypothetical protein